MFKILLNVRLNVLINIHAVLYWAFTLWTTWWNTCLWWGLFTMLASTCLYLLRVGLATISHTANTSKRRTQNNKQFCLEQNCFVENKLFMSNDYKECLLYKQTQFQQSLLERLSVWGAWWSSPSSPWWAWWWTPSLSSSPGSSSLTFSGHLLIARNHYSKGRKERLIIHFKVYFRKWFPVQSCVVKLLTVIIFI